MSSAFPSKGGCNPLHACGTCFSALKITALDRMLDRFGAYVNHLLSLTEDPSTKPTDKQKLKGYAKKWKASKLLIGCALFHDILKPTAILSKIFFKVMNSVLSSRPA